MPLPSATFDPTKSVVGRNSIISITIGGSPTHLLGKLLDYQGSLDLGRLLAPGASNGPVYTARVWEKSRAEFLKFEMREIDKMISLLGSLVGARRMARARRTCATPTTR